MHIIAIIFICIPPNIQRIVGEFGASCDTPDHNGDTPLHIAAARGHSEVVKWLLNMTKEFADVNVVVRNKRNETPIHLAAKNGHERYISKKLFLAMPITYCHTFPIDVDETTLSKLRSICIVFG